MRVLVLRALGLGDLLTAVPALRALRDAHPDARLVLACPAWLHELVGIWELADELLEVGELEPLPEAALGADLGVNLHGRGPESTRIVLAARPRGLVAFRHPGLSETRGLPHWRPREHERERWCRLLRECGIPASPERLELPAPRAASVERHAGCTVLHQGASAPSRCWPWPRWAEIARAELEAGRSVVLTGASSERARALAIARRAGVDEVQVLAGETSLVELAALVGVAGLVVCGDTGVAHLATALGTVSVVLFGPVAPQEWGPPPGRPQHRALWAGRLGDPHAPAPDPGLLELRPEDVLRAIGDLRARVAA